MMTAKPAAAGPTAEAPGAPAPPAHGNLLALTLGSVAGHAGLPQRQQAPPYQGLGERSHQRR